MASPNASTFDIAPPYRPGNTDFNGSAKVDDSENPPDPTIMPSAAEYNTLTKLMVAIGKVIPVAVISVKFAGGTPVVQFFSAPGSNVTLGTFTLTDNGIGDTTIGWPTNTFPPLVANPTVSLNGGSPAAAPIALPLSNSVRVKTFNLAGSSTDIDYTVAVY